MSQNIEVENEFTFLIWNYEIIIMTKFKKISLILNH